MVQPSGAESSEWIDEVYDGNRRCGLRGETVFAAQSEFQQIRIVRTDALGRGLLLDGMWMTAEGDERIYHEMLVHPALTTAPRIRRVLVIGGGDGGTVREVLRHRGVEHVEMVEIDGQVVSACKEYLPTIGTAWDDPRLHVRIADGAAFVRDTDAGSWDVILVDGSDPVGPAAVLFEGSFFAACARALHRDGVLAVQGGSPTAQLDEHLATIKTMRAHFADVAPLYAPVGIYPGGAWSFIWATSGAANPRSPDRARVGDVAATTSWYNEDVHRGAFAVPNVVKLALDRDDQSD